MKPRPKTPLLRRLYIQLTLFGALVLAATILLYAGYMVSEQSELAFEATKSRGRALANNISAAAGNYLVVEEYSALDELLIRYASFPSVLSVRISDEQGTVYGNVARDAAGAPKVRYDDATLEPPSSEAAFERVHDNYLEIWAPIENGTLGWVRVDYSLQAISDIQGRIWRNGLIAALVAFVLSMVLLLFLVKRPIRAIEQATKFAKSLYRCDGAEMEVPLSTVETEELGHALNDASRRLQDATKGLEDMKFALDAHAIVGITDADGRITYANDRFCEIAQWRREELLGKTYAVLKSGHHSRSFFRNMWESIRRGRVWQGEILDKRRDGTCYWVDTTIVPFVDAGGTPYQYISIQTDITERRRAEEVNSRMGRILDNSSNEIYIFDGRTLCFTQVNLGARQNLGYTSAELSTMTPLDLKPEFTQESFEALIEPLRAGRKQTVTFETIHRRKDGSEYPVEVRLQLSRGETPPVFVATIMDITERKHAEWQLRQYQEHLEDMVAARTNELTVANRELESFCYSVSHDLRAPLRSIDGFSQALLEDHSDALNADGKNYLRRVRNASQRMGELIDDLLKLSRVVRVEMDYKRVNLSEIAGQVARRLKESQPERNVEFNIEQEIFVEGDRRLLLILMENLLGNAWKFTGRNSQATIEFGRMEHDSADAYYVRDNGAGFDPTYTHKLFQPFQRLHSNEEFEGTGVGLATVQRIVSRHSGRAWADSEIGKGTTLFFTLGHERHEYDTIENIAGGR